MSAGSPFEIFAALKTAATQSGYEVKLDQDGDAVFRVADQCLYVFAIDPWLQVRSVLFTPEEYGAFGHRGAFWNSVAILHQRLIGCRFSCDKENTVWITEDIYPEIREPSHVLQVFEQIRFVSECVRSTLQSVALSGAVISEQDLDAAFGFVYSH